MWFHVLLMHYVLHTQVGRGTQNVTRRASHIHFEPNTSMNLQMLSNWFKYAPFVDERYISEMRKILANSRIQLPLPSDFNKHVYVLEERYISDISKMHAITSVTIANVIELKQNCTILEERYISEVCKIQINFLLELHTLSA